MVEIVHLNDKKWSESINRALTIFHKEKVELGIFSLSPGERSPPQGFSVHSQSEEYAYVIEGEILFCTNKECYKLKSGDIMYNPPGTPHYTENKGKKEAKIIWAVSPPL